MISRLVSSLVQWHHQKSRYLWSFSSTNLDISAILPDGGQIYTETWNNWQHVKSAMKRFIPSCSYFLRAKTCLSKASLPYSSHISFDLYYILCLCLNQSLIRAMKQMVLAMGECQTLLCIRKTRLKTQTTGSHIYCHDFGGWGKSHFHKPIGDIDVFCLGATLQELLL